MPTKIVITKHSKQRRPHHDITPDLFLTKWVEYFDDLFNLHTLEFGIYKIYSGSRTAIIRVKEDTLILITFRGYKDFNLREKLDIKIKYQPERLYFENQKKQNKPLGEIFWLDNSIKIKIRNRLIDKFNLPVKYIETEFNSIEELKELFFFKNGQWILKEKFNKINTPIYRKNYYDKLVICGEIVNEKISLNYNLQGKYKIPVHEFNKTTKDNTEVIQFNKEHNCWLLNNFQRIQKKEYTNKQIKK